MGNDCRMWRALGGKCPTFVPDVVLRLAFAVTFNVPSLKLTGTTVIIVLMLFIRRLPPSGVRSNASILKQIKAHLEEAAGARNASPAWGRPC